MGESDTCLITKWITRAAAGEKEAEEHVLRHLYDDLHARARSALRGQPAGHTLHATALVNEAYLRLMSPTGRDFQDRVHFLSFASRAMRSILVDHARRKRALKRDRSSEEIALDSVVVSFEDRVEDLEALEVALQKLEQFDPEMGRIVQLRFFGGVDVPSLCEITGMARRTLERRWNATRAWLRKEMA